MRFPLTSLFLGVTLLALMACGTANSQQTHSAQMEEPEGTWYHAYEQDTDSTQTYVREGEPLPPARFRQQLTLNEDHSLVWGQLAANDAHGTITGTWAWQGDATLVLTLGDGNVMTWEVIRITETTLVIAR